MASEGRNSPDIVRLLGYVTWMWWDQCVKHPHNSRALQHRRERDPPCAPTYELPSRDRLSFIPSTRTLNVLWLPANHRLHPHKSKWTHQVSSCWLKVSTEWIVPRCDKQQRHSDKWADGSLTSNNNMTSVIGCWWPIANQSVHKKYNSLMDQVRETNHTVLLLRGGSIEMFRTDTVYLFTLVYHLYLHGFQLPCFNKVACICKSTWSHSR